MFKNGGVGALGQMGTQEAAVRAERWAWIVLTRAKGTLRTFVDGQKCAEVQLQCQWALLGMRVKPQLSV